MTALIRRPAHPLRSQGWTDRRRPPADDSLANLRLFVTGWAGGMIFFFTFFS